MSGEKKRCLVAGALGIAGRALLQHLEGDSAWDVVGLSRRTPDFATRAHFVSVDLLDAADCRRKLESFNDNLSSASRRSANSSPSTGYSPENTIGLGSR